MCRTKEGYACCSPTLAAVGAALLAVLAGGLGVASWAVPHALRRALDAGVHKSFTYEEGSSIFPVWKSDLSADAPTVHFYMHVFNVTNPLAVQAGAKPQLDEIGPLRFTYATERLNITFSEDGDLATYWLWQYYIPEDAATEALLEQPLNQVYMPSQLWGLQSATDKTALGLLNASAVEYGQAYLFRTKTIREVLFGYSDPFVDYLSASARAASPGANLPKAFAGILPNMTTAAEVMNKTGPITQFTGKFTRFRAYEYTEWNGSPTLRCCAAGPCQGNPTPAEGPFPAWSSDAANIVRGTYGSQFRQGLQKGDTVYAFEDNLLRPVALKNYGGQVVTHRGIDTLRFSLDTDLLQNVSLNPANAQWNMTGPSGLLPVGGCQQGVPVFLSKPHFRDVSPAVPAALSGLAPPSDADETMLDVEPVTGATMYAHERLQVSVHLNPNYTCYNASDWLKPGGPASMPCWPALRPVYMPIVWVDRWLELSEANAATYKKHIGVVLEAERVIPYAVPAAAAALAAGAVVLLLLLGLRRAAVLREELEVEDGVCFAGRRGGQHPPRKEEPWGGMGDAKAPYTSLNDGRGFF